MQVSSGRTSTLLVASEAGHLRSLAEEQGFVDWWEVATAPPLSQFLQHRKYVCMYLYILCPAHTHTHSHTHTLTHTLYIYIYIYACIDIHEYTHAHIHMHMSLKRKRPGPRRLQEPCYSCWKGSRWPEQAWNTCSVFRSSMTRFRSHSEAVLEDTSLEMRWR